MNNIYELNGVEYQFRVMPPSRSVPLSTKVLKIIAGGGSSLKISDLADLGDMENFSELKGKDSLIATISGMITGLEDNEPWKIITRCQEYIFVKDPSDDKAHRVNIEKDFNGKLLDLYKVTAAFLRYTLADFFPESLLGSEGAKSTVE